MMVTYWKSVVFQVCVVVLMLVFGTACDREARSSSEQRLILSGSSTIAPLAGELGSRFESLHPGVRVDVQSGGSSRGIADVRRTTVDVGMVSRGLHPEETDLESHTIAIDGITLILHVDNPVEGLSDEQVVGIYTGRVRNWSEVGGDDAPITVVHKAEGRSTLELFLAHFELKSQDVRPSIVIGDNQHGIRTLVGDPNAVGYVSIGTAHFEASQGRAIKLLALGGVEPTLAHVREGSFPLARPLNLVTTGEPSPLAKEFIAFAQSEAVHELIEAQSFVPFVE